MTTPRARAWTSLAACAALIAALAACTESPSGPAPLTQPATARTTPSPDASAPSVAAPFAVGEPEVLVSGLEVPWGLDFLASGDAIVTERDSLRLLRVTASGEVVELGVIAQGAPVGESGLLGVAVPPTTPGAAGPEAVYVYVTTEADNRVLRVPLLGEPGSPTSIGEPEVVLEGIPNGFIHDGGRIAFGPDGMLHVATGEVGDPELAQDRESLGGKILRITPDGDPAPDNPDPTSPVWTLGHRNVQGLAWDDAGRLWASEFGDSDFDELNLIAPGNNYGWPEVEGVAREAGEFTDPMLVWGTQEASPSGIAFAHERLWVAALAGDRLWEVEVLADGTLGRAQAHWEGEYGRLRTAAAAPDGSLWVTTSNRDGRGEPGEDDDRILVLRP